MPKFSALKTIEASIIPVCAVVAVKLVSTWLISYFFQQHWQFVWENPSFNYYLVGFDSQETLIRVSNWSDLLTVVFIATWFSWLIFKTNFLNETSVHPSLARKLYQAGITFFIGKEEIIYHQLLVWIVIVWLYLVFVTANLVNGYTSAFVYGITLSLVLVLTAELFVFDKALKN